MFYQKPDCRETLQLKPDKDYEHPWIPHSFLNAAPYFGSAVDLFFTNSKPILCPVSSCKLFRRDCLRPPPSFIEILDGPDFKIKGDQTDPWGWEFKGCVMCENAESKILTDSVVFTQIDIGCHPDYIKIVFDHYAFPFNETFPW